MKELLYYSIFAIVLYFILTYVFENFNLEQENFDPSLVPVSSIVTLAKVAQKLVNGNGTLTNPGNLQIGMPGANTAGNLTVTGNTTVSGTLIAKNIMTTNSIYISHATQKQDVEWDRERLDDKVTLAIMRFNGCPCDKPYNYVLGTDSAGNPIDYNPITNAYAVVNPDAAPTKITIYYYVGVENFIAKRYRKVISGIANRNISTNFPC